MMNTIHTDPRPSADAQPPAPARTMPGPAAQTPVQLLIVDDDSEIRSLLGRLLGLSGFAVTAVKDAAEARQVWARGRFQLVVLDLMISGEGGFDLFRWLRLEEDVPIVLTSASGDEIERIIGLESGADDFIVKPFNPRELQARILAVLRRSRESQPAGSRTRRMAQSFHFEGWTVELSRRRLLDPQGIEVPLTGGEYDLLLALMDQPQHVMTRDVAISRLRRKLNDNEPEKRIIRTVRGGGYVFVAPLDHH